MDAESKFPEAMQALVTIAVMVGGFFLIIAASTAPDIRTWAMALVGNVASFWLGYQVATSSARKSGFPQPNGYGYQVTATKVPNGMPPETALTPQPQEVTPRMGG